MANTPQKIFAFTGQLENTLETLANNPNGSPAGIAQAANNLALVAPFNAKFSHAANHVSNIGLGGSSSSHRE